MVYKFGCDPEVFVRQNGQFVTAHNLVPGTKTDPHKVPFGAIQVDGMALEFNIDPAETADQWVHNIKQVYHALQAAVPGYQLVNCPTADFNLEYFKSCPDEAKILGCDPDYNAYTGGMNEPPQGDRPFRTAAGHVHIGWLDDLISNVSDPGHIADCELIIRNLDYTLGIQSLLYDADNRRRSLYGAAGAYRPKPYGVEYRVLSNVWLESEDLQRWVFNTAKRTMELIESGVDLSLDDYTKTQTQRTIKNSDVSYARDVSRFLQQNHGFEPVPKAA